MPESHCGPVAAAVVTVVAGGVPAGLLDALGAVEDPRKRRGLRHSFTALLAAGVCAVLTGARSYAAIAEWIADAGAQRRTKLGLSRTDIPDLTTIWRLLIVDQLLPLLADFLGPIGIDRQRPLRLPLLGQQMLDRHLAAGRNRFCACGGGLRLQRKKDRWSCSRLSNRYKGKRASERSTSSSTGQIPDPELCVSRCCVTTSPAGPSPVPRRRSRSRKIRL